MGGRGGGHNVWLVKKLLALRAKRVVLFVYSRVEVACVVSELCSMWTVEQRGNLRDPGGLGRGGVE